MIVLGLCCSADFSLVAVHGLRSCGPGALECRLRIRGLNLCLLHWQMDSSPLSPQGSPVFFLYVYVANLKSTGHLDVNYQK